MNLGDRRPFRWIVGLLLGGAILASFVGAEFDVRALFGAQARAGAQSFLAGCWPPRTDPAFLALLAGRTVDTLAMAFLGTALATLIGAPLAALSSRNVVYGAWFASGETRPSLLARAAYLGARGFGAVFRSIPEVIWALLFVRVTGLGPLPAILALGIGYGGLIAKVCSEQIEDVAPRPVAALEAVGAGRVAAFVWGIWPQAFPAAAAYVTYQFECGVRASVLMGFVGAGGLGYELQVSYGDYLFGEVLTETALLVAVVLVLETTVDRLGRRW